MFKSYDLPPTMNNFRSRQNNDPANSFLSSSRSVTIANVLTPTQTVVADVQELLISSRGGASSAANKRKPRVPKRLDWFKDVVLVDFRLGKTHTSWHLMVRIEEIPGMKVRGKDKRRHCRWCTEFSKMKKRRADARKSSVNPRLPTHRMNILAKHTMVAYLVWCLYVRRLRLAEKKLVFKNGTGFGICPRAAIILFEIGLYVLAEHFMARI